MKTIGLGQSWLFNETIQKCFSTYSRYISKHTFYLFKISAVDPDKIIPDPGRSGQLRTRNAEFEVKLLRKNW